jgi:hypothetical protein
VWAIYLLPLSGLFMSVIYPTINSKGISCVPKSEHGAAAGVILFITCASAVLAPLTMGADSDALGHIVYGFWLATVLAALLLCRPGRELAVPSYARRARPARREGVQRVTKRRFVRSQQPPASATDLFDVEARSRLPSPRDSCPWWVDAQGAQVS